jgi:myo-inositol-1(or 4)-monophosphatase
MPPRVDWLKTLIDCKNNVRERISPFLKVVGQPPPDLGIGAGGDPIRQLDLAAEKAIVDTLVERQVSFTLISEESGLKEYGHIPQKLFVTVDPIDGSTNLERGIPFYATSLAVSTGPALSAIHTALVADLFHDITYTAQKGKGAHRNGLGLVPSRNVLLKEAVIGVDLNSYKAERTVMRLTRILKRTSHVRHFGANALELCYVADGTADAFIDIRGKLRTTDMAAAWLILEEAGAKITSPSGEPLSYKLDPRQRVEFIASANKGIHKTILGLMK